MQAAGAGPAGGARPRPQRAAAPAAAAGRRLGHAGSAAARQQGDVPRGVGAAVGPGLRRAADRGRPAGQHRWRRRPGRRWPRWRPARPTCGRHGRPAAAGRPAARRDAGRPERRRRGAGPPHRRRGGRVHRRRPAHGTPCRRCPSSPATAPSGRPTPGWSAGIIDGLVPRVTAGLGGAVASLNDDAAGRDGRPPPRDRRRPAAAGRGRPPRRLARGPNARLLDAGRRPRLASAAGPPGCCWTPGNSRPTTSPAGSAEPCRPVPTPARGPGGWRASSPAAACC